MDLPMILWIYRLDLLNAFRSSAFCLLPSKGTMVYKGLNEQ